MRQMRAGLSVSRHNGRMRHAFAHDAVLSMNSDADERAPGAAVTVALCGHWEHEPPCPLSPHHVHAERVENDLHVRVLFATEAENEREVRGRIERALSGQGEFPVGFTTPWRLLTSRPSDLLRAETDQAERLIQG